MSDPTQRDYLDDAPRDIQDLLYRGAKIEAIKEARTSRGLGLKDAKDTVDSIEARMRERFPTAMPQRNRFGCFTVVLALGASFVAVALLRVAVDAPFFG